MKITKYIKSWMLAFTIGVLLGNFDWLGVRFLLFLFISIPLMVIVENMYEKELEEARNEKKKKHNKNKTK